VSFLNQRESILPGEHKVILNYVEVKLLCFIVRAERFKLEIKKVWLSIML
jgi:hypothetical protein